MRNAQHQTGRETWHLPRCSSPIRFVFIILIMFIDLIASRISFTRDLKRFLHEITKWNRCHILKASSTRKQQKHHVPYSPYSFDVIAEIIKLQIETIFILIVLLKNGIVTFKNRWQNLLIMYRFSLTINCKNTFHFPSTPLHLGIFWSQYRLYSSMSHLNITPNQIMFKITGCFSSITD